MTTSCQPSPQPQASGMAAMRASSGTTTKTPTSARWAVVAGSSSKSERVWRGVMVGVAAVGGAATGALARSAEVVIVLLAVVRALRRGFGPSVLDAYVTVTYGTVG